METKGRDLRNFEEEEFKRKVRLINWDCVFNDENLDVANYTFENKLLNILNLMAPMKARQSHARRKDWISKTTKQLMSSRDQMRNRESHVQL